MMQTELLKKVTFLSVCALMALGACSRPVPETGPSFGVWQVEGCRLYANRADIHMSTDGRLSSEFIYVKVSSSIPLARTPLIAMNELHTVPIKVEGTDRHFSFELPFTPPTAARMMSENSFIVVNYRPANHDRGRKAFFSTQGLPTALSYIGKNCLNY